MPTVTVPKKLAEKDDLVVIPRKEYEQLLIYKQIIPEYKPTRAALRALERGEREISEGKFTPWEKVKDELAALRNRRSKKAAQKNSR